MLAVAVYSFGGCACGAGKVTPPHLRRDAAQTFPTPGCALWLGGAGGAGGSVILYPMLRAALLLWVCWCAGVSSVRCAAAAYVLLLQSLAPAAFRELSDVNLSATTISEGCVRTLQQLCPLLRRLNVDSCRQLPRKFVLCVVLCACALIDAPCGMWAYILLLLFGMVHGVLGYGRSCVYCPPPL